MLQSRYGEIALLLALVLPFFLVTRWDGLGFVASVLIGWLVVHFANTSIASDGESARIDPVFKGIWLVLGPLLMSIWSAIVAALIWFSSRLIRGIRLIKTLDHYPEAGS